MGRRCHRAELQRWSADYAGYHREDCAYHIQKIVGATQRRQAEEYSRKEYLSLLAGVYGVLCKEVCKVRRADCGRLLWNDAATHQSHPWRVKFVATSTATKSTSATVGSVYERPGANMAPLQSKSKLGKKLAENIHQNR